MMPSESFAELAREQVPEEVAAAYGGKSMQFGHDYIIPAPFDPRLDLFQPDGQTSRALPAAWSRPT